MLDVFIGIVSSLVLLKLYSFLEKKRIQRIGNIAYVFVLFVLLASFLASPSEHPVEWGIWLGFFYTVLDDLRTRTVYAPIYIFIIVSLFLVGQTLEELFFALIVLGISLFFVRKTKETFLSLGDVYCLFALAVWLDGYVLFSFLLSVFLAAAILPVISFFYKASYYAFTPFLVMAALLVKQDFYVEWFFTGALVVNVLLLLMTKRRKK